MELTAISETSLFELIFFKDISCPSPALSASINIFCPDPVTVTNSDTNALPLAAFVRSSTSLALLENVVSSDIPFTFNRTLSPPDRETSEKSTSSFCERILIEPFEGVPTDKRVARSRSSPSARLSLSNTENVKLVSSTNLTASSPETGAAFAASRASNKAFSWLNFSTFCRSCPSPD